MSVGTASRRGNMRGRGGKGQRRSPGANMWNIIIIIIIKILIIIKIDKIQNTFILDISHNLQWILVTRSKR